MGGLSGVSSNREGTAGAAHGTGIAGGGMCAAMRGNSGRHAVPMHADRSQDAGMQQSHGASSVAAGMAMSSHGMPAISSADCDAPASCQASTAACAGTTRPVATIERITSQCTARRASGRNDMGWILAPGIAIGRPCIGLGVTQDAFAE